MLDWRVMAIEHKHFPNKADLQKPSDLPVVMGIIQARASTDFAWDSVSER